LIERGQGPTVVEISARRRGVIDTDFEAWLLKRRRLPSGWAAEEVAPQLAASEAPAGHAEVDAGEGDAEPRRAKATPSRRRSQRDRPRSTPKLPRNEKGPMRPQEL
jgi:hypothetical protein